MTLKQLERLLGTTVGLQVVMVLVDGVIYRRGVDGSWEPYDDVVASA